MMNGMDFRARLVPALLLAGLVVLAACGPTGDRGEAAGEIVVHRGIGGDAGTLDPAKAQDTHAFNVLSDLYEGLLGVDASGAIVNAAAESWSVSEDGLAPATQPEKFGLRAMPRLLPVSRALARRFSS